MKALVIEYATSLHHCFKLIKVLWEKGKSKGMVIIGKHTGNLFNSQYKNKNEYANEWFNTIINFLDRW